MRFSQFHNFFMLLVLYERLQALNWPTFGLQAFYESCYISFMKDVTDSL